jgi:hypothetical protein
MDRRALLILSLLVGGCAEPTFDHTEAASLDIFVPTGAPLAPQVVAGTRATHDDEDVYTSDDVPGCTAPTADYGNASETRTFVVMSSAGGDGSATLRFCAQKAEQWVQVKVYKGQTLLNYNDRRYPGTGLFPRWTTWTTPTLRAPYDNNGCGHLAVGKSEHDWWNVNSDGSKYGGPGTAITTSNTNKQNACVEESSGGGGGGGGYYDVCYYEDEYNFVWDGSSWSVYYLGRNELGCERIWET